MTASFSPQRPGPERLIVDALSNWLGKRTSRTGERSWMAEGVPIGAGEPDLVATNYRAELTAAADVSLDQARLLAYLRGVRRATVRTAASRLATSIDIIATASRKLCGIGAVVDDGSTLALLPTWREILVSTMAIEAKVADWRRAALQAARNRVFAHMSFIALPGSLARRISVDPIIDSYRIGVLAVEEDGAVAIVRRAPRSRPLTWFYHYYLALGIARHLGGESVCRSPFRSTTRKSSSRTTRSSLH